MANEKPLFTGETSQSLVELSKVLRRIHERLIAHKISVDSIIL